MIIPKFETFVYPRQAIIYCNTHGTSLCFCFEYMQWEEDFRTPDRPCNCLEEIKPQVEIYFINRFNNKQFN
jgi:hypothetical protein